MEAPDEATRALIEETEAMHTALRDIAQAVINDADSRVVGEGEEEERSVSRPLRSARSPARTSSPGRRGRSRSPAFADSTYSAVQAALDKRALQVQELRAKLNSSKEGSTSLKKALDDSENERRRLEHQVGEQLILHPLDLQSLGMPCNLLLIPGYGHARRAGQLQTGARRHCA